MDLINMNLSKLRERVKDQETWRAAVHGDAKSYSLEKSLMLGKIEGRRRRGHQRMRRLDCITNAMNKKLGKLQEMVRDREA